MAQHTSGDPVPLGSGGDVVMDVPRARPLCVLSQVMLRNPPHVQPQRPLKEPAERP